MYKYETEYGNYIIDEKGKVTIDYSTVCNSEIGKLILHIKESFSEYHQIKNRHLSISRI